MQEWSVKRRIRLFKNKKETLKRNKLEELNLENFQIVNARKKSGKTQKKKKNKLAFLWFLPLVKRVHNRNLINN